MTLTSEQKEIGKLNFKDAVDVVEEKNVNRRAFLKTAAAGVPLAGFYFGYRTAMTDKVRVGFIGTGDEGSVLLTQHPPDYMDVVAVADIRPTNLKRAFDGDGNDNRVGLIKKLGVEKAGKIKKYNDHKELLADPQVEAVVIAVPLNMHKDLAIEAMRAGKHVLCEKLMAWDIAQCKEMIKVSKETGMLLAVGHQRHYSVLYENCNELIQQGLLGDIKFIRACWHRQNSFPGRDSWNKTVPVEDAKYLDEIVDGKKRVEKYGYKDARELCRWRLYNNTGGGLMAELGSHQLDACSIFLGKKHPLSIQGYGGRNFFHVHGLGTKEQQADDREIDDHVYVIVEFPGAHYDEKTNKDDVVVVTYSSINHNAMEKYGETVFGSRGTMIVEEEQRVMLYKEEQAAGDGGPGQRLVVLQTNDKPVLSASPSQVASKAVATSADTTPVSRGYTEEMQHFAWCIRHKLGEIKKDSKDEPGVQVGLRCPGTHAMGDAIMALTANLAMKHKKRIVFKPEWFDPDSPATPEQDEGMKA